MYGWVEVGWSLTGYRSIIGAFTSGLDLCISLDLFDRMICRNDAANHTLAMEIIIAY